MNIPSEFPLLKIDGFLMEQVLVNLLENASRYTPAGSEIEIRPRLLISRLRFASPTMALACLPGARPKCSTSSSAAQR